MTDELSIDAPQFREIVLKENPDGTWECAHGVFTSCTKCSKKAQDARAPSLVKAQRAKGPVADLQPPRFPHEHDLPDVVALRKQ